MIVSGTRCCKTTTSRDASRLARVPRYPKDEVARLLIVPGKIVRIFR
jgi:hypothetical protein